VAIAPPNALEAPKPTSSSRTMSTFGAPAGGRTGSIGGNAVPVLRRQMEVYAGFLEAAGLPEPTFVNGIQQTPIQGTSMRTRSSTPARPSATRRSTSRCSGTARSTTRAGPR
jgi:hypothetical protein